MIMKYAKRTDWPLEANKITKMVRSLRQSGETILDLTESNPTRCGFVYPREILKALSSDDNMNYRPSARGLMKAREAVCSYYARKDVKIHPENIILTSSTSEAYTYLFRLLADPHDDVLFPRPSYPLFQYLVDLNDILLNSYPLIYHEGWGIDLECLGELVTPKTKAIVLVNPNNPTGSLVSEREIESISHYCRDQMALISDEVFGDFIYEKNGKSNSLIQRCENLTFCLGGLSKSLGLPHMKLSWIAVSGPKALVNGSMGRLDVIADTFLSVNTPAQNALQTWFDYQPDILGMIQCRIRRNIEILKGHQLLKGFCRLLKAEGGWYAVLKMTHSINEEDFILKLLEEDRVLVHPGYFFDFENGSYLILSLLVQEDIFEQGLARMNQRILKLLN